MDRRQFLQTTGGAAALAGAALAQQQQQQQVSYANYSPSGVIPGSAPADPKVENPPRKAKMHVGTQHTVDDVQLGIISSFGVNHICSTEISPRLDENWSADGLSRLRERVEKHGVTLSMVPLPLPSAVIGKAEMPAVMLGQSPQRDRDIEALQQMVQNCAKVGIPAVKYNMSILGVQRIGRVPGRGSATYSYWNYDKAPDKDKLTEAGAVSPDEYWERIDYFLARMVPVAAEYKVRMACHPHDPGMPPQGYRRVPTVLGSVDGLKKFIAMHESPYHGLNFCQGTVSEMLKDPNREIHDVIRYFGSRKKVFNVHFRNIRGGFSNFVETFPDNGSVNLLQAARTWYEVDYPYMLMPDHVPQIPGDRSGYQAFAFAFGYIQAAIQMLG